MGKEHEEIAGKPEGLGLNTGLNRLEDTIEIMRRRREIQQDSIMYHPSQPEIKQLIEGVSVSIDGVNTEKIILIHPDFEYNSSSRIISTENRNLRLRGKSAKLIDAFLRSPGGILTHTDIGRIISNESRANVVTSVFRLNEKLRVLGIERNLIEGIFGIGYRFIDAPLPEDTSEKMVTADFEFHAKIGEVHLNNNQTVNLTTNESKLLFALMKRFNQKVDHNYLASEIWGIPEDPSNKDAIRVFVSRVRSKLKPHLKSVSIDTVPGKGYLLHESIREGYQYEFNIKNEKFHPYFEINKS